METWNVRFQRCAPGARAAAHLRATCSGTTRSAVVRRLPLLTSRSRIGVAAANGGLATTRNGRRGRRRSVASACTTVTELPPKRSRRTRARPRWSSTATTRAPRAASRVVSAPVPAPMSRTRSRAQTPASATRRSAHRSVSRCHPQCVRRCPDTTHHDHAHRPTFVGRRRTDPARFTTTSRGDRDPWRTSAP